MKEECIVSKIKGNTAYITLVNKERCGGCKACALGKTNKSVVPAFMEVDCKVGDCVVVETPLKDLSLWALFIYAIPLVFLVIGFIVGGLIASAIGAKSIDIFKAVFSMIFMVLSFVLSFFLDKLLRQKKEYRHRIIQVIFKDYIPE